MTKMFFRGPGRRLPHWIVSRTEGVLILALTSLVTSCFLAVETLGDLPLPRDSRQGPSDSSGPTLLLNRGQGKPAGNRVAEFMYFVALISPEPVSVEQSPENTQRAHLVSVRRRDTGNSFLIDFEFRFAGQGYQRNIFDHTEKIRQQERKLKDG